MFEKNRSSSEDVLTGKKIKIPFFIKNSVLIKNFNFCPKFRSKMVGKIVFQQNSFCH